MVLACCSAALYLFFALVWTLAAITEDQVRPGDMPMGDGLGAVLAVIATAGAAASLFAAWSGFHLWRRERLGAITALVLGTAIGVLPALLFV